MRVSGREFSQTELEVIQEIVEATPSISRRQLSRRVSRYLDWRSANGTLKEMSCRKALAELGRKSILKLPEVEIPDNFKANKAPLDDIEVPGGVSGGLSELGQIDLWIVDRHNKQLNRTWNALMERYHYLGRGPLCGAQLRYLVHSERYGYLGGLAFSAPAWRVGARDRWIGWNDQARQAHLQQVVCNSRFLILPQVRVPHLASHLLSRSARRLREDWQQRYGYGPVLLETYVERDRFRGTSYRAANWHYAGDSNGRGRQDKLHRQQTAIKAVYLYPLVKDWQKRLCGDGVQTGQGITIGEDESDWATEEFGCREVGDKRLQKRLWSLSRDFFARPQANVAQACGSRAKAKAAYRFFDHPRVTMEALLDSHYGATARRMQAQQVVLAVQDTTSLNYTAHRATQGLGPINTRQDHGTGLIVHDTLALTPEGTPLGLLDVQCWSRDPEQVGKREQRQKLPSEQKESAKWLKSYQAVARWQQRHCPETMVVSVGDREADIHELFLLAQEHQPELLVRAVQHRQLEKEAKKLWQKLHEQACAGIQEVDIPRQGKRQARTARLSIRFSPVEIAAPQNRSKLGPVALFAILASEAEPPEGLEPLKWMLLTTLEVKTFEQATEKLAWYAQRWNIEIYHRTIKSGCRIEQRQLAHAKRIEACLAIDMVVAWRIFYLTKLGRELPDAACTVFFEEDQWKALCAYTTKNPIEPEQPPSLRQATRMVATLGGFLGRKSDGEPGTKSLWLGLQRLDDITEMWRVMRDPPPRPTSAVLRKSSYG